MSELRKATHKLCNTCRYSMGFGSQPSNANCPANICCNYLEITGHSRIFYNGGKRSFPKEYCDKYEKGRFYPSIYAVEQLVDALGYELVIRERI